MLYVISTIGTIGFAVRQRRFFVKVDANCSTMADYAAFCTGFPVEDGPDVEKDIEAFVTEATGIKPVGVSVCWNYAEKRMEVINLMISLIRHREEAQEATWGNVQTRTRAATTRARMSFDTNPDQLRDMGRISFDASSPHINTAARDMHHSRFTVSAVSSVWRRACCIFTPIFRTIDSVIGMGHVPLNLGQTDPKLDGAGTDKRTTAMMLDHTGWEIAHQSEADPLLAEIRSCGIAIAVFPTELERDNAVTALESSEALYKGEHVISAHARSTYDPETIMWENFSISPWRRCVQLGIGIVVILAVIVVWGTCCYWPYAYYEATSFAALGHTPPLSQEFIFTILVVVGNQAVYFACSAVAERVGFETKDHAQAAYVILYTMAIQLNTAFDIFIVVYTGYLSMVAKDVRSDDGTLLKDLPDSAAVFMSYPMMKQFGRTLYHYSVPNVFILPFIMEALFTIVLPYHLGCQIVRSRSVDKENAEACLVPIPMDLSRYGDLLVNVSLAVVCFFTTSGYVLKTLIGLLIGSIYIYGFDHYRVLRQVEAFYFSSGWTDAAARWLLIIPCAILGAIVVAQLRDLDFMGLKVFSIWFCLIWGFVAHLIIHILAYSISLQFGNMDKPPTSTPYSEAARHCPGNWFTTNPVHCLRSKFMHNHEPPCIYYMRGKENVLEKCAERGAYYTPRKTNEDDDPKNFAASNCSIS